MKILCLHSDFIEWEPKKKAMKDAEEIEVKKYRAEETLVVFSSVEKQDEGKEKSIIEKTVTEIIKVYDQVKATSIVVYPYVHLSTTPSNPKTALSTLKGIEKALKDKKLKVYRAPFGWYKMFNVKCKGHPLSELSREISSGDEESDNSMEARMETASHLVFDTTREITGQEFISISETSDHKSVLHWRELKFDIDNKLIEKIQMEVDKNLSSKLEVKIENLNRAKAIEKCGKIFEKAVPKDLDTLRVVSIGKLPPEPCGNPHVSNTEKIANKINIVGYKKKGEGKVDITIKIPAEKITEAVETYDIKQLLREISKTRLDKEKLKENDHRILGQRMNLFSFSETAPGMVFWHDKGWKIYNELVKFWREEHRKAGYKEISTPIILDKKLWQISGHWEKYRDNIFLSNYEDREFAVKPMNCPGGMLVYKSRPRSYRDLPLRVGELGVVHRQELSGVLTGLFRAVKFTQDDAHIYCTEKQMESEIAGVMEMADMLYRKFGFGYDVELSTRPEKRIGSDKVWDKAEKVLESVLKKRKMNFKLNKGDGAFYGPKIDFHIKDSLGRTWQCATIQLDFSMPERFELTYTGEDNSPHRPVMLHRTIYGSMERFIGILLEHLNGNLPVWLSPVQVKVMSFTERNIKATQKIHERLLSEGILSEVDLDNNTVDYKIREAEMQKINYMIVIGDKEEEKGTISVRKRGERKVEFGVDLDGFIKKVRKEIENRT